MSLSIEHLPAELWLIIFSYLEGHDLQWTFSHLNSFFTALLGSPRLRVYYDVKTGGCEELSLRHIPFFHEGFEALHANIDGTSNLLIFLDGIHTFPNLRSFSVHIRRPKNYRLLISILPRLTCLQHLTISCGMFGADNTMVPLHAEILKLPRLRMCELRLSRDSFSLPNFNPELPISSSLRRFHIDAWIRSADLCHLVKFMPPLRFLNVYLYHHNVSSWNDLSLPQLTKMACLLLIGQHIDLENLVRVVLNLIHLYLHIEPYSGLYTIKSSSRHTISTVLK